MSSHIDKVNDKNQIETIICELISTVSCRYEKIREQVNTVFFEEISKCNELYCGRDYTFFHFEMNGICNECIEVYNSINKALGIIENDAEIELIIQSGEYICCTSSHYGGSPRWVKGRTTIADIILLYIWDIYLKIEQKKLSFIESPIIEDAIDRNGDLYKTHIEDGMLLTNLFQILKLT